MKQVIDVDTWKRKDNFRFFSTFINPCISVTSEVVCTQAREWAHNYGNSFFVTYLYAILKAINKVEELRYRIKRDGEVVVYDEVDVLSPIQVNEDGKFTTVRIPWIADFNEFHQKARNIIKNADSDENPYSHTIDADILDDNKYNVVLVSATPNLYFTSMTHTQELRNGSDFPLLNVGKAVIRNGELVIPIAINVHHGLVDGKHLSDFFSIVEDTLKYPLDKI